MIVEQRTYTLQPGRLKEYLSLYHEHGLPLHRKHYVHLVGYYTPESGDVNQVVHQWAFASHDERARRREALQADPAWQVFLGKVQGFAVVQESRFFKPTPWSPDHLAA